MRQTMEKYGHILHEDYLCGDCPQWKCYIYFSLWLGQFRLSTIRIQFTVTIWNNVVLSEYPAAAVLYSCPCLRYEVWMCVYSVAACHCVNVLIVCYELNTAVCSAELWENLSFVTWYTFGELDNTCRDKLRCVRSKTYYYSIYLYIHEVFICSRKYTVHDITFLQSKHMKTSIPNNKYANYNSAAINNSSRILLQCSRLYVQRDLLQCSRLYM